MSTTSYATGWPSTGTPAEILTKMSPLPYSDFPISTPQTLAEYDAFFFGIPTRYGNMPAQLKVFWVATRRILAQGRLIGKYPGVFGGTSGPAEDYCDHFLVDYGTPRHDLCSTGIWNWIWELGLPRRGSPWGAGTFSAADGSRCSSEQELKIAEIQGGTFMQLFLVSTECEQKE
ncbi:hypothetical protein CVT25_001272 [Psilocybe cyanescens]|uniref:Flavodoxin-like domain-containing protein n=1 Tax=Psilocybe cyanescens TaxID=93625 RepID=A0A409XEJ3_PSICY|nr:hypothetical protein CVT25_001272 [Psilocybe cyanescens]